MSACGKNYVGLWEKSSQFLGKIKLVCGKNSLDENFNEKYTLIHRKKIPDYLCLQYLPRYRVSKCLFDGKFVETENSAGRSFEDGF